MADLDDLINDINNTVSTKKGKGKKAPAKKAKDDIDDLIPSTNTQTTTEVKQEISTNEPNKEIKEQPKQATKEAKKEATVEPVKPKEEAKATTKEDNEQEDENEQEGEAEAEAATDKKDETKKKKVVKKVVVKKGAKGKDKDLFLKLAQQQVLLNKQMEDQRKKEEEEALRKQKEEEERQRKEEEERQLKLLEEEKERKRRDDERIAMKMKKDEYEEFCKNRDKTLSLLKSQGLSLDEMLSNAANQKHKKKKHVAKEDKKEETQVVNENDKNAKKESMNETKAENSNVANNTEIDDWECELDAPDKKEVDKKIEEENKKKEAERLQKELEEKLAKEEELKEAEITLRKPIICVLGHVDTGKTKILDKIRRTNVQLGEAGGITQQIGATNFPLENIEGYLTDVDPKFKFDPPKIPGFLIIDTPGHESFQNLRSRGQSLCDLAVVVIDIMHGLENQTISSLEMLKKKKTPFIIALNKIDRIHEWKQYDWLPFRKSYDLQKPAVRQRFDNMLQGTITQLIKVVGLNTALFDRNENMKEFVNIIPTSAFSGEGIPDLMNMFLYVGEKFLSKKLTSQKKVQCSVLEVKVLEGTGHTIDVVLVNGTLKVGDKIIVAGMNGPIKTVIKYLLTPQPMKDIRIKTEYTHHKEIDGAIGLKIFAKDLEGALAGSTLYVYKNDQEAKEIVEEVDKECDSIIRKFINKEGKGVLVTSSSLGALEACLEFLNENDAEGTVMVAGVSLGFVQKKDVIKILTIHNKEKEKLREIYKEEVVILAFDVHIHKDAQEYADLHGVKIITAEKIYELKTKYAEYRNYCFEERKKDRMKEAIFPCSVKIVPKGVFHKYDPVVVGVDVEEGMLKTGTPLYCVEKKKLLGVVESIEKNGKQTNNVVKKDGSVAVKIKGAHSNIAYKTHFDEGDNLISNISRLSIDRMKEYFYDELEKNQEYIDLIKRFKVILDIR